MTDTHSNDFYSERIKKRLELLTDYSFVLDKDNFVKEMCKDFCGMFDISDSPGFLSNYYNIPLFKKPDDEFQFYMTMSLYLTNDLKIDNPCDLIYNRELEELELKNRIFVDGYRKLGLKAIFTSFTEFELRSYYNIMTFLIMLVDSIKTDENCYTKFVCLNDKDIKTFILFVGNKPYTAITLYGMNIILPIKDRTFYTEKIVSIFKENRQSLLLDFPDASKFFVG